MSVDTLVKDEVKSPARKDIINRVALSLDISGLKKLFNYLKDKYPESLPKRQPRYFECSIINYVPKDKITEVSKYMQKTWPDKYKEMSTLPKFSFDLKQDIDYNERTY